MLAYNKTGIFHISCLEYIQNLCLFKLDIPQAALPNVLSEYADTNQSFFKGAHVEDEPAILLIFHLFSLTSSAYCDTNQS